MYALGFSDEEMIPEEPITVVGGAEVDAWSAPEHVHGLLRFDTPQQSLFWGPIFVLDPLFVEHEDSLLGRTDFMNIFDVVFSKAGPAMHIYHP